MRLPIFCLMAVMLLSLIGCESEANRKKTAAEEVVKANVEAMRRKNVDGVMATIDPKSPAYEQTKLMVSTLFGRYNLDYTLENVEVIKMEGDKAEVKFTQITKRKDGTGDFRDSRIEGRHFLRDEGGQWKIYNTIADKVDYLDQDKQ